MNEIERVALRFLAIGHVTDSISETSDEEPNFRCFYIE